MNETEPILMKTNEINRNKSDRNINLNIYDKYYEFFGNMSGKIRKYYKKDKTIYFYNNDNGFTDKDKNAIKVKNQSGNNNNTAGHNGFGISLVIDRLLPDDLPDEKKYAFATIYSLNDKQKFEHGHFHYKDWKEYKEINKEHELVMKEMNINFNEGTFIAIPLNEEHNEEINNLNEQLKLACIKFNNIKISENEIDFFWNGEKQSVDRRITPCEDVISINYQIGHFKKGKNCKTTRLTLYLKIQNYTEMDNFFKMKVQNEYIAISKIDSSYFYNNKQAAAIKKIQEFQEKNYNFISIEEGRLNLNIVSEELPQQEKNMCKPWIDGCSVVIENHIVNLIAIKKCLKIENSTDFSEYNGRPRIENHIQKTSKQYNLPVDKSHIKPTIYGERVLSFARVILQTIKKKKSDKEQSDKGETDKEQSDKGETDKEQSDNEESDNEENDNEESDNEENDNEESDNNIQHFIDNDIQNVIVDTTLSSNDASQQKNKDINDQKRRTDFKPNQKKVLSMELTHYWLKQNDKSVRCPCCQRLLYPGSGSDSHAGHIISCYDGGSNELQNGLLICQKCNNNDKRHMYKMMIDEWGPEHYNTKKFIEICEYLNKKYLLD